MDNDCLKRKSGDPKRRGDDARFVSRFEIRLTYNLAIPVHRASATVGWIAITHG